MDPSKIQGMMKKMGISQTPLNVNRVIFEMADENLVIDEPSVLKVMMQGQETYQVSGEARAESKEGFSDEDVDMVKGKTGKSPWWLLTVKFITAISLKLTRKPSSNSSAKPTRYHQPLSNTLLQL